MLTDDPEQVRTRDYINFYHYIDRVEVFARGKNGTTGMRKVSVIRPVSGSGQVIKVNARRMNAVPPWHASRLENFVTGGIDTIKVTTARVDAGENLGMVTAVLNGAVTVGVQETLL